VSDDRYGLPVATTSPPALDACDRGVEAALGWKANALDLFREATRLDPSLGVAHAGAAACLFLEERFGEAGAAAATGLMGEVTLPLVEGLHAFAGAPTTSGSTGGRPGRPGRAEAHRCGARRPQSPQPPRHN
jgi:hypothetical protein